MDKLLIKNLFDLNQSKAKPFLEAFDYPWQALSGIGAFIIELGKSLPKDIYEEVEENVWIAKSANIFSSAYIMGPCIIGENTEIRHGAFIRGKVLIGDNCVVGNSCECKNSILFNKVQTPHYNYIGDSILGYASHMGAGAITSNIKSDKANVSIKFQNQTIDTSLRKVGAFLGNYVEVGCNSVLNPGTIIGPSSNIYPLSSVRGFVDGASIYKNDGKIIKKL